MRAQREDRAQVVVSPHPDDAVWSLGGRLAHWVARGVPVTVVTVFDGAQPVSEPVSASVSASAAGSASDTGACRPHDRLPPAHPLPSRRIPASGSSPPDDPDAWRHVARPAIRRREDRAALGELGVGHVSLGFADAALRTSDGRYRYRSAPRLFAARHPDDHGLPGAIRDALRPLCPPGTRVHGPLAAGRHVDHVVSRAAVERLAAPGTAWYEDFPYPLRRRDHDGLAPSCHPLADAEVERWLAAALHYASQAEALFGGGDGLRRALLARARAHGGEAGAAHADRHWLPAEPEGPPSAHW
ncbi:PIG-L deacetylase family protein [Streptomyces pacificus]|uniref:PIG-L family deacetylase n=1 Tax=Streptomyces pacificus TaxID=2705029 RepID=A0A6A0AZ62_9ACTN|nr:PIG-L family deacetylase [Streptomyces pacificus]GFH38240.1 PIG-L family deacetylase [Streptomyces pacificus]